MSRYARDDKEFRASVARLADAGLRFPSAPPKGFARPANAEDFVPNRLVSPEEQSVQNLITKRLADKTGSIEPPTKRGHFNLPGLVAGVVMGALLTLGVIGWAWLFIHFFGGSH